MARRDSDPQRARAGAKRQRGNEFDCLAVDAGVHRGWGLDLQVRGAPGSPGRVWPLLGCVDDQDSELTAGEGRSTAETWTAQRVWVVGDQQHGKPCMFSTRVVNNTHRRYSTAGT